MTTPATAQPYVTEEKFLARYGPDDRVELVDGVVEPKYGAHGPLTPTSNAHGDVVMNLLLALGGYVRARGLGRVYTDPAGFVISDEPRRIRCPDVAFVRADRIPALTPPDTIYRLAPDLAAEVVSPSEPRRYTERKIAQYLAAGVRLAWKIEPRERTVTVYTPDAREVALTGPGALDGLDVVPGFTMPLAELFAGVADG